MADFSPDDFNAGVQMVAGEGADQPPSVQQAMMSTAINRAQILGKPIRDVVSDPAVYNGWGTENAKEASLGTPLYQTIAKNIAPVFTNGPTTKATHFWSPKAQAALGRSKPGWDNGTGTTIGDNVFVDRSDLLRPASATPDEEMPSIEQLRAAQKQGGQAPSPQQVAQGVTGGEEMPSIEQLRSANGQPTYDAAAGVTRNPDGSIAGIGDIRPSIDPDGTVNIKGTTNPQAIAAWIAKHPGDKAAQLAQQQSAQQAATQRTQAEQAAMGAMGSFPLIGPIAGAGLGKTFLQGVSQNFSDEASGALFGAETAVKNALGFQTGYTPEQAAAAKTQAERAALTDIAKQQPIASTATQFAGAALPWLAVPIPGAAAQPEAATALGRVGQYAGNIARGTATGGVMGGAMGAVGGAGAAQGGWGARLQGAIEGGKAGALAGAALGGGLPALAPFAKAPIIADTLAGLGAIRQGARNALTGGEPEMTMGEYFMARSPIAKGILNAATAPDTAALVQPTEYETRLAQDKVEQMLAAKGMHRDDLRAAPPNFPTTTAEFIGSTGVNHLASLSRRSGTTPDLAAAQVAQRAEQLGPDIQQYFTEASGIDPTQARVLNEDVTGAIHKDDVTPAYKAALDVENPKPVMTWELAKLQQDPDIAKAISAAARLVAKSGREPFVIGNKINPDTGAQIFNPEGGTVTEQQPTPETWDLAKKFVDKMIARDPVTRQVINSGEEGVKNVFLQKASGDMRDALVKAIPGYDKALASASDELSRKAAFEFGTKNLFSNLPAADFKVQLAKMSPDEREAAVAGVANSLFNKGQSNQLTAARLKTPLIQAKLREVLGDKADEFIQRVTQRLQLHASGQRIMPGAGSQTTPLGIATAESAPTDALGNAIRDVTTAVTHPHIFAAKQAVKATLGDQGKAFIETPGYRNAYGRLLLQHPRETANELSARPGAKTPMIPVPKARASAIGGYIGAQSQSQ